MKRLILLAVCAVALFAFVPSSASCPPVSVDGSYLCYGGSDEYGPFEFCLRNWSGNTFSADTEICADSNNDAWSDAYVYEYGDFHAFWTYLYDDSLQTYASAGGNCVSGQYDVSSSYYDYDFGSC